MFILYKNLDSHQPITFESKEKLKSWMLKNKWQCDGLCFLDELLVPDDAVVDIKYIECYENWEVEEFPEYCSTGMEFGEAVDEFIDCLGKYLYL